MAGVCLPEPRTLSALPSIADAPVRPLLPLVVSAVVAGTHLADLPLWTDRFVSITDAQVRHP